MIKKLLFIFSLSACALLNAQESESKPSVEKNQWGATIGLVEAKVQNEIKLARKATLRFEAGVDLVSYSYSTFNGSAIKEKTGWIIAPTIVAEPLFYYNLDRRAGLNKNTSRNSGNYFSLRTLYAFNESELYNSVKDIKVSNMLAIIPKYGIRRTFAKNFFYEFGFGIGWQHNLKETKDKNDVFIDLSARIGINF